MKAPQNTGGGFEIPEGTYTGVCIMVIDCGVHKIEFSGETSYKRQIYLRWELPKVIIPEGDYQGERACVGRRYTFSMHKKANLRRDLETWRGRPFTDEAANQFDFDSLIGKSCTLQIFTNDKGYSNINLITPSSETIEPSTRLIFDTENPYNYEELPEWVKKKINMPSETSRQAAHEYADVISQQVAQEEEEDDFNDSIPF